MKFANSYRLIKRDAVLDDTWHPLDGGPAPEYVPERWDGPHAGKRLVDGLRTLMLMPMPRGPQAFGNAWPEYMHDWCDLVWQEEMDTDQRELIERVKNKTHVRPSATEDHAHGSDNWLAGAIPSRASEFDPRRAGGCSRSSA
jgi:hypothetical protein